MPMLIAAVENAHTVERMHLVYAGRLWHASAAGWKLCCMLDGAKIACGDSPLSVSLTSAVDGAVTTLLPKNRIGVVKWAGVLMHAAAVIAQNGMAAEEERAHPDKAVPLNYAKLCERPSLWLQETLFSLRSRPAAALAYSS
jgi:hypothetical protein